MPDPEPDFMDAFDDVDWRPARELFQRLGFEPLPSAALDDFQLPGRLWELIYAMAGRRFYLSHTDHHTDRVLYAWLSDEWMDEEVADLPPEDESDCDVDASDFGNGLDPIIWLQYFATEQERQAFAVEHHLESLPIHTDPPCDRDRWLPVPPGLPDDLADDPSPTPELDEQDDSDPLGLEKADAEIRAEQERQRELSITGGEGPQSWQHPIDQLQRSGVRLLPPDELTDETVTSQLWELMHNLACRGIYVLHTDHFSDRELYTALWKGGLREQALIPGKPSRSGGWFHDFIGSGSDEDTQVWLRFYATDDERAQHAQTWPEDPMPPREKPAFNRDWRLPKGPF
jgi:hypothetical protein